MIMAQLQKQQNKKQKTIKISKDQYENKRSFIRKSTIDSLLISNWFADWVGTRAETAITNNRNETSYYIHKVLFQQILLVMNVY